MANVIHRIVYTVGVYVIVTTIFDEYYKYAEKRKRATSY